MDQIYDFELKDLDKPVYLHLEFQKFWEIKLNSNLSFMKLLIIYDTIVETLTSNIRAGKLADNQFEEQSTIKELKKKHDDLGIYL